MQVFRRKTKNIVYHGTKHIILVVTSLILVYPLLWMFFTSLKTVPEIWVSSLFFPKSLQWKNYYDALTYLPFHIYFRNTVIIAALCVMGHITVSSLVAYSFSHLHFPGRDTLFTLMISTMIIPPVVYLVPQYLIFNRLGWVNTFLPLVVPAYLGFPFYIFLLRQFFSNIPEELLDAARIDGCSELGIWWKLILPLSRPALSVIGIFSIVGRWNDFMAPLIYLIDQSKKTLALGLYEFMGLDLVWWNWLMAAAMVTTMPLIIMFVLFQKQFMQGITLSGLKG